MKTLKELMLQLNTTDECSSIEAKKASEVGRSILETVCAYSNEPNLGGGYLLLGVEKDESSFFPEYTVSGIAFEKLDKIKSDLSSQCADSFNRPIRPQINTEEVNGKKAIVVFIDELSAEQKPLYFKNGWLPQAAYRRIGSADIKCTEDDLRVFYGANDSFDGSVIKDANLDDISEDSIELYRKLRAKINPTAEELTYSNTKLLISLNAIKKRKEDIAVTYTGLLTFGSRPALRRLLPMVRVDYIRVSTNEWIEDPNNRFATTIDMRGSLLELVQRIIHTIGDDLPKGFELTDEDIQAKNIGLPLRVLREAVVNALIHRSYRENSPIQIIRYPNRIEIINPGFSLKTEEQLGEPGSVNRNQFIAAIFHETNLAETKGSGIRTMRTLMEKGAMLPPTFESDREGNKFTVRLLLHHLLNEEDLKWLENFENHNLTDNQKRILIFVREVGAVDNSSARQINGSEAGIANIDLRKLRKIGLLNPKGKNRFTYYLPTEQLKSTYIKEADNVGSIRKKEFVSDKIPTNLKALPTNLNALPTNLSGLSHDSIKKLLDLKKRIDNLPKRINDKSLLEEIILKLCEIQHFKLSELSGIIKKNEKYLYQEYIKSLLEKGKLVHKHPDMINHPEQAYITVKGVDK